MQAELVVVVSNGAVDPDALRRSVRSISLDEDVGMACEVVVELDVWDSNAGDYDRAAVEALYHGNEFELWDLDANECLGLFVVDTRETTYGTEGPVLSVSAYDGLRQYMLGTEARVYYDVKNDFEWIKAMADEYGMKLDSDPKFFPSFAGDRVKEIGKTDLEMLKQAAVSNGLGLPTVVYDPKSRTETLRLRPLAALEQGFSPRRLRCTPDGTGETDLLDFKTRWDKGEIPVAVEVIGWDKAARKPFRVVVEATQAGPRQVVKEYRDIPKTDAKKVAPGKGKKGSSRGVVVHLLGDKLETVDTGIWLTVKTKKGPKRIRSRRQYREILHTTFAEGIDAAVDYATRWIQTRIEGYYVCEGELVPNARELGRFRVSQAHYVTGTLDDDEGWYILTAVSHRWSAESHTVEFSGQRLLEEVAGSGVAASAPR